MAKGEGKNGKGAKPGYQFGAFQGVYTPSVLTILGVIMYLRFGWVLGNVGLPLTLVIVTLATAITFLTGLSLSSLATNMRVEGGGAYFIISRSLGVEAGAAIGLPLFLAQALGISFYIAGFSEAVVDVFPHLHMKLVGVVTLVIMTILAAKSADIALKSQFIVMAVIFASLISFFIGSAPDPALLGETAAIPAPKPFWIVFAVFFPAVTGIEAGIAMSGDLKKPARSLPRGTLSAILTGYLVYIAVPIYLSSVISDHRLLLTEPLIMRHVARWGQIIVLGVWAASISSAMGALLGAPRTLQALARDRVIPAFFGRGFGRGNDPRIATATAFLIGLAGILGGDLNFIAPVLSMFFLTSYGLLNVSAGLEELTSPPSWRPKFRVPWMVSLAGAFACFAAMFMISPGATFVAWFVAGTVYFLMERRSMAARWGDMRNAILRLVIRSAMTRLSRRDVHERTWRPNILVMSGSPASRWYLTELANAISHDRGFLTVAAIVPRGTPPDRGAQLSRSLQDYLDRRKVPAFAKVYPAATPLSGARTLAQAYGYGPVNPNTILLGETERPENYREFADLLRLAHERQQNVIFVREGEEEAVTSEKESIIVWWYGAQQNLALMLALAHLLKRGEGWRRATLTLKSIVPTEKEREGALARLRTFIEKVRVDAKAEVVVEPSREVFPCIREHSAGADLVLLGMRAPEQEETAEAYADYYGHLVERSSGLPPVAFVLASEEIDFRAIFAEV